MSRRTWAVAWVCAGALTAATAAHDLTGTLVVLNKAEASASLLDLPSGREIARLPTGEGPHEVTVGPGGRLAVVADFGVRGAPGHTLTVIDLVKQEVVKTIDLGEYHRPHGIQFMRDGKRVVVTAEQEQHTLVVNVSEGSIEKAIKTGQQSSHMVVMGPDQKRAYVANIGSGTVSVLDLDSGVVVETIATGDDAEGIDIAPDGRELWVGNRSADTLSIIDTKTLEVTAQLPCAAFPIRVKFMPGGKHVLVSNASSGDVAVFDAAARKEIKRISMQASAVDDTSDRLFQDAFGRGPVPVGILVVPGARQAFVANTNADVVTVIDVEHWTVVGRLRAGKEPDGMAYSPLVLRDAEGR